MTEPTVQAAATTDALLPISTIMTTHQVTARTLRYWEQRGLITPTRSETGRRLYSAKDESRISIILFLQRAGLSLEEIGQSLWAGQLVVSLDDLDKRLSDKRAQVVDMAMCQCLAATRLRETIEAQNP
ncbi:MerR family transcriptional regulator [Shimia ponticola]|uniref:MerR family transcriptional regulator n=1 Tax=Shimia ponticola TaxID=2582893 RepID=UPI0011BE7BB8|nr:MerR family transcriptional regulator [Shimia ponticola]